jgi:hypothetical protein
MLNKIRCFLGLHDFEYLLPYPAKQNMRRCKHCKLVQSSSYDMATGYTYWADGNYWFKEVNW